MHFARDAAASARLQYVLEPWSWGASMNSRPTTNAPCTGRPASSTTRTMKSDAGEAQLTPAQTAASSARFMER
jgi:hypothetical protein